MRIGQGKMTRVGRREGISLVAGFVSRPRLPTLIILHDGENTTDLTESCEKPIRVQLVTMNVIEVRVFESLTKLKGKVVNVDHVFVIVDRIEFSTFHKVENVFGASEDGVDFSAVHVFILAEVVTDVKDSFGFI